MKRYNEEQRKHVKETLNLSGSYKSPFFSYIFSFLLMSLICVSSLLLLYFFYISFSLLSLLFSLWTEGWFVKLRLYWFLFSLSPFILSRSWVMKHVSFFCSDVFALLDQWSLISWIKSLLNLFNLETLLDFYIFLMPEFIADYSIYSWPSVQFGFSRGTNFLMILFLCLDFGM